MKKRPGIWIGFLHKKHFTTNNMRHEVREMFIGHHTIFSMIGVIVGGSLVAKTLWYWLEAWLGMGATFSIGFVMFIVSALWLHSFDEYDDDISLKKQEDELESLVE